VTDENTKQLNANDLLQYLPHRYPFILIDKVLDYSVNEYISAIKNVSANEPFFQGHFPGNPVMPGVLILEAMAQASCVLSFLEFNGRPENMLAYFAGINNARFRRQVLPGDVLKIDVKQRRGRANLSSYDCVATVDGNLVCEAQILCTRREV
jgi:3-hydroxyacyl-[acyl-carrier-protein] dehydratase